MWTFYIITTLACLIIDLFMLSLFKKDSPRLIRILWSIGLFLPIWNLVQCSFFYFSFFLHYATNGDYGEYEPRDTKWAKWFLNEE